MALELSQIKQTRKKLGLTQTQLAGISGVSQSLIAKIEAGSLYPAYTNAKKIFDALESFGQRDENKAKDVMNQKIIVAQTDEKISDVIKEMKKRGISQMPVFPKNQPVGFISENTILDAIAVGNRDLSMLRAEDVMDEVPPIVPDDTPLHAVANLLKYYSIVLVGSRGKINGLISKADILSGMYGK